jgi:hypothetical protein
MSKILVPNPPLPAGEVKNENSVGASAPKSKKDTPSKKDSPLDAAFLGRIYRSMLWFGAFITILAALGLREGAAVSSIVAGMALAAVLLRAQEIGVRALMQPKEKMGGMDARLFMVILLPIKFLLIVVVLATLNYFKLIAPGYLALGFFVGQLVIVAKVVGWMMTRSVRN